MIVNKKYDLIPQEDTSLFRIRALRDFANVKAGDLGGFVEKEQNLSHHNTCWIYDHAKVFGNAHISDQAIISDHAIICDNVRVYKNVCVSGYAQISDGCHIRGDAKIMGFASVSQFASVHGNALVNDYAHISGSCSVYGNARVSGNANVRGNAVVYGDVRVYDAACIYGDARVYDNAHVHQQQHIKFGHYTKNSLVDLLRCSLGVHPTEDGYVYVYKRVNKDYTSEHDSKFVYPQSGLVEAKEYDPDPTKSCASGLHFSTNEYWPIEDATKQRMLLAEVHIDDIIACQEGKIRVKKAHIIKNRNRS